jgi:hypothetical protein
MTAHRLSANQISQPEKQDPLKRKPVNVCMLFLRTGCLPIAAVIMRYWYDYSEAESQSL